MNVRDNICHEQPTWIEAVQNPEVSHLNSNIEGIKAQENGCALVYKKTLLKMRPKKHLATKVAVSHLGHERNIFVDMLIHQFVNPVLVCFTNSIKLELCKTAFQNTIKKATVIGKTCFEMFMEFSSLLTSTAYNKHGPCYIEINGIFYFFL